MKKIIGGKDYEGMAQKISDKTGYELGFLQVKRFPDNEAYVRVLSDVKGVDAYLVKSAPTDHDLVELLLTLDALKDLGARKVVPVIPYLPYARQDSRFNPGEALSAKTILSLINNYADTITTLNAHFLDEKGTYQARKLFDADLSLTINNLDAFPLVANHYAEKSDELVVIAPDKGAKTYAEQTARLIGCEHDYLQKTRLSGTEVEMEAKELDVQGLDALLIDDGVATGGTIITAAQILRGAGARKIFAGCVHGGFAHGTKKVREAVDELVSTNTIPSPVSKVDVSTLIAESLTKS